LQRCRNQAAFCSRGTAWHSCRGLRDTSKEIPRENILETTGSDEFDAFIDKEAASRRKKLEQSPESKAPWLFAACSGSCTGVRWVAGRGEGGGRGRGNSAAGVDVMYERFVRFLKKSTYLQTYILSPGVLKQQQPFLISNSHWRACSSA